MYLHTFSFNDPATTEIYTLSLHDALPIYNDPALTQQVLPTLREVAGANHVTLTPPITPAEDFSRYQQRVPGVLFFLGITPPVADASIAAPNHAPRFFVDEDVLPTGVRALAHLAGDY